MKKHFTATVYVLDKGKALLLFHQKYGKWLPPGGHLDPDETPVEAAHREVWEEAGLKIQLASQENLWIDRWNAVSMERPYMCLVENIPATDREEAHQHIDFIYVATPLTQNPDLRWFTLEEVLSLKGDEEIFVETQDTLRQLLQEESR